MQPKELSYDEMQTACCHILKNYGMDSMLEAYTTDQINELIKSNQKEIDKIKTFGDAVQWLTTQLGFSPMMVLYHKDAEELYKIAMKWKSKLLE